MRELTRSVANFTWAMSTFGVEQMANLMSPQRAAGLRTALRTGDRLQRSMVDLSLSLVGMGPSACCGGAPAAARGSTAAAAGTPDLLSQVGNLAVEFLQLGVDTVYWVTGTAWNQQQGQPGWGPVPPPDGSSRP